MTAVSFDATLMQTLAAETAAGHRYAKQRPLERAIAHGMLPREIYLRYLSQRYLIHRVLEDRIALLARDHEQVARLITEDQLLTPHALRDLTHFRINAAALLPLPATTDLIHFIDETHEACPVALLGIFYVFEGAKNGGHDVARALRPALHLTTDGTNYLDPHGDEQHAVWAAFKHRADALELTRGMRMAIVAAAQTTFDMIAEMDDQLMSS